MSPVKVLVVDDLSDMRSLLKLSLKRNGWHVIEAADGSEAIEVAQREQPQVILMDYDMPVCDGLTACQQITSNTITAHIPIIIYTGHGGLEVAEHARAAGAAVFLLKPIPPSQLRDTIQALLPPD